MADPFAILDDPFGAAMKRPRRKATSSLTLADVDLPPSLLTRALHAPVSGLSGVANLIGVPGSMVLDTLAGENPLDQAMPWNWFSPEGRTSGRDLLKKWGAVGPNRKGLDMGDVAGFAAEVLLDPTTYLSGGLSALGKGGKAAAKAGLLKYIPERAVNQFAREMGQREGRLLMKPIDLIAEADFQAGLTGLPQDAMAKYRLAGGTLADSALPLGGSLGVGFMGKTVGTVNLPGAVPLARGVDALMESVRFGKYSPVRPLAALFVRGTHGAMDAKAQKIMMKHTRLGDEVVARARDDVAGMAGEFEKQGFFDVDRLYQSRQKTNPNYTVADAHREIVDSSNDFMLYLEGKTTNRPIWPTFLPVLDNITRTYQGMLPQEQLKGLISNTLDEIYLKRMPVYLPLSATSTGNPLKDLVQPFMGDELAKGGVSRMRGERAFSAAHPSQIQRAQWGRQNAGGTAVLNHMSVDQDFQKFRVAAAERAIGRKGPLTNSEIREVEALILNKYDGFTNPAMLGQGIDLPRDPVTNALTDAGKEKLRSMAVTMGTLSPQHVTQGIPMYELNPLKALDARIEHSARAMQTTDMAVEVYGNLAEHMPTAQSFQTGARRADMPNVAESINKIPGLNHDVFKERVATALNWQPASGQSATEFLREHYIDQNTAKSLARAVTSFTQPQELQPFMEAMDKFLGWWKTAHTSIWPAFHTRNFVSGMYQNWVGDSWSPKSMTQAWKLHTKEAVIHGIAAEIPMFNGMTDAAATERLRQMFFAYDITGYRKGFTPENLGEAVGTPFGGIPGAHPMWTPAPAGTKLREQFNPLKIISLTGQSKFAPERWGHDLATRIEGVNRGTGFIEMLKQGYTPEMAAKRVAELQVDYKNLSSFEKNVMKRVFPFYSFTRHVLPATLDELWQRPGGKLGQTMKGVNRTRGTDEYTPDYVADTASIQLGGLSDGTRKYLTSLGLMFEDPVQLSPFSTGGVRNALMEVASRTNPLLKGALEWMTGEVFFQKSGSEGGRSINDLDPTLGRILSNVTGGGTQQAKPLFGSQALEFAAANSPAGRALFTTRTLTDPRKLADPVALGTQLLTGSRITHVSPGAQDAMLREAAGELMRKLGGKQFTTGYIPDEVEAQMSPEELRQAKGLEMINQILSNRAKARKAQSK